MNPRVSYRFLVFPRDTARKMTAWLTGEIRSGERVTATLLDDDTGELVFLLETVVPDAVPASDPHVVKSGNLTTRVATLFLGFRS